MVSAYNITIFLKIKDVFMFDLWLLPWYYVNIRNYGGIKMNENPTFSPEAAIGDKLADLKRGELIDFAIKVCKALSAESDGNFRGGIRPDNIMLCDDLAVLGPAAAKEGTEWTKAELEYLAPELFWNGKGSARSDIYSIGLMLYFGVNGGRLPFVPADADDVPDSKANALKTRMNGEKIDAPWGVGKKFKAIIEKATAFKEMERYFDASELETALRKYLEAVPVDVSGTAKEVFGKSVDELSVIERIMVDIIHTSLIEDDVEEPTPIEEPEVVEEPLPVEEPAPIEESTPAEEPAPIEESAPVEEPIPAEESAPIEEPENVENDETVYEPSPAALSALAAIREMGESEKAAETPLPEPEMPEAKKTEPKKPAKKKKPTQDAAKKPAAKNAKGKKKPKHKKKKSKKKSGSGKSVAIVLLIVAIAALGLYLFWDKLPFTEQPEPTESIAPTPTVMPSAEPSDEPTPSVEPSTEPVKQGYEIIIGDLSWDEAELACVEKGGHLVTINSQEEYDTICAMLRDYNVKYVWIGCYRDPAGLMTWTSGQDVDLYFWQQGEPSLKDSYDGAEENYVMMVRQSDDTWLYNDSRMDPLEKYSKYYTGKIAYICEYGD